VFAIIFSLKISSFHATLLLCYLAVYARDALFKIPTLRVSPSGWTLKFWPDHSHRSFLWSALLWGKEEGLSGDARVHGAKVRFKHCKAITVLCARISQNPIRHTELAGELSLQATP
jgi:hypothetical protein